MDKAKKDELEITEEQGEINTEEVVSNNILEEQNEDKVAVDSNVLVIETQEEPPHPEIDEEKEPTKEFDIVTGNKEETKEPVSNKNDKKKLFIIIGSIVVLIAVVILIVILLLNKEDGKEENEEPNSNNQEQPAVNAPSDEECQKIIKEYGNKLALYVRDHISAGNDVATIKIETVECLIDGYKVECETFDLQNNGNIKLDKCSINGSKAIYGFEKTYSVTKPDTEYLVESENGKIVFYYDGYSIYNEEYDDDIGEYKKYSIKCEEESCVLDEIYAYYAVVKEKSGKSIVYNFYNNSKIYTLLAGYDVNIMGKYFEDWEEDAFALTIKNPEKQEALYSLEQKKIVVDYGIYTYDWESDSYFGDTNVVAFNYIDIYANGKHGLLDSDTFAVVIEPNEYDKVESTTADYIYVYKEKYMGLLKHDKKKNALTTLIKPNKYDWVSYNDNHILVRKSGKYGAFDTNGKTQFLNGKFYDAVAIANYKDGGALILDGTALKLLDLNGNLVKSLKDLPKGTKLYNETSNSYNDEDEGVVAWFKLTNPNYDESASDKYYDCLDECDSYYYEDDDEYYNCEDNCEQYYDENKSHDCIEYSYNFTTGNLETYYSECEGGYAKPVLYLYPVLPTFVTVTFEHPEKLTTTYPKYNDGWKVLASPTGDLYDLENKYYYALYWEEDSNHTVDFSEGFYVTKNNAIEFLEEKLDKIGFTARERNEFIMYWLPILEKNEKSLVYFELTEERDAYSKINISPKPDSLLRVAIHIKKVDSYTKIKEQKLPTFKRKGFTAVEWGGVTY